MVIWYYNFTNPETLPFAVSDDFEFLQLIDPISERLLQQVGGGR